jgi:hypothetical protein
VPAVAPVVAPVVERWAAEPLVPDWHWAFEAGGGAMALVDAASGGIAAELLPIARIERAFGARLCARVGAAGLGTMARVSTPSGYANVSQCELLAEVLARFRRGRRLEPIVSIGAGALRVSADGHELAPYQSASGVRWSMAADAGVGLRVPLQPHRFELGVEVHALLAEPYPVVRFFDKDVARAGRPSVLGGITLLGGL